MLLLVCVVVVVLAMRDLLARVDEQRGSVAVALALAVLAVLPAQLGRPFDSVVAGLLLTTLLCAPLALLGALQRQRRGTVHKSKPPRRAGARLPFTAEASVAQFARENVAFIAVLGVLVALGAWVEIGARLWDGELGHYGFSASIARGVLPPEHPLFPGEPLRYHVGFDVLVALVVTAGLDVGVAVHVVSIALLALACFVLRDVGRALAMKAWAACVPAVALLGYGPASACLAGGWASPAFAECSALFPSTWVSAQTMPPTVMSSFFQHPQGLAIPIALSLMLLACTGLSRPRATARLLVCAVGLALLSQSQIVFFACAGLAIGVVAVGEALLRRAFVDALVRSLVLGAAGGLGLWASLIAGGAGELRFGRGYFDDAPVMLLLRHLAVFGPTILAVPFAAWRIVHLARARPAPAVRAVSDASEPRDVRDQGALGDVGDANALRVALLVAAVAGFAVANAFTYARSWDIVKFFAVASVFANVLLADLLSALARHDATTQFEAGTPWRLRIVHTALRRPLALAIALLVLSIASASFWLLRHGPLNGVVAPAYGLRAPSALGRALFDVAAERIGPRDVVLTRQVDIWQLGFHVAGAGRSHARGQLIDVARADERQRIAQRALRTFAREDLDALSVDWVLTKQELPADRFAHEVDVLDQRLYRVLR